MNTGIHIILTGRVQGVGFRYFVVTNAERLNIYGSVQNIENSKIEIFAYGSDNNMNQFIRLIKKGPSFSQIDNAKLEKVDFNNKITNFSILY